ncbi:MAG: outer membrane beta-barrel protein [Saprospiraceae bacterium]|nr:outer membrane beta-barrel protein [Saprospiraceae bacterium]
MKKQLLSLSFLLLSVSIFAQKQQIFTVSGGYSWANVFASNYDVTADYDITGTGWRINGLYELNPNEGPMAWGLALGYISVSGEYTNMDTTTTVTVGTIPVYLAPKYMFGQNNLKGFVKAMAGMQFANIEYDGPKGNLTSDDFGFYGGGGVGILYFIRENVFLNLEYEFGYMSNSYYRDGIMQSAMGGVGIKF